MLKKSLITVICALVLAIAASLAGMVLFMQYSRGLVHDGGPALEIKWEGLVNNWNFRDLGKSLNQCLEKPFFVEGRIMRANVMFSGWECARVGSPQVVYSLNFAPERNERYFCRTDGKAVVGRYFNPDIRLNDIEFIATWQNPAMVGPICLFLGDILQSIGNDQPILIHCDAGRDRTGAISALLAALAAENSHALDTRMVDAIECDYTKSRSLAKERYGSMRNFLGNVVRQGGVTAFLAEKCALNRDFIQKSIQHWLNAS